MNRTKLKNYAPQARRDFIQAMTDRAAHYGLTAKAIEPVVEKGDVAVIGGRSFPGAVANKRKQLEDRIKQHGFDQTIEAMAYTWFNRLVAIRFMEVHGYLDHGYRVLSHPEGKPSPEILEHAEHVELPGLKKETVIDLKLAGNKESELYRLLLTAQCNALHAAMPFLFEKIDDETELLLPDNLLHSDSLIRKLVGEIDEDDWQEVEIIGWLYQFYISEKKAEMIGKVVASEDIPAATQLFTPNWIVKYLVQNTLGRQWLATYPTSALRQQMDYYIEPAEQTPEVQQQLKAITPMSLNPEELTLLDPACGSGHILVEAYDLFKAIYLERGYRARDIPALILNKNLFGLEIDDRAAQLAAFALMMKARADDRRIFDSKAKPNVMAMQESKGLNAEQITYALNAPIHKENLPKEYLFEEIQAEKDGLFSKNALAEVGHIAQADIGSLLALFENAKTFGSLIQVPPTLAAKLPEIEKRLDEVRKHGDLTHGAAYELRPLLRQATMLAQQYDAVVANPPYMGSKYYTLMLKSYINKEYKEAKADLYACFMERNKQAAKLSGFHGMINIPNWMFLSSFEDMRKSLFETQTIDTFVHNGRGVFGSDFGSCAFVIRKAHLPEYRGSYRRLFEKQGSVASNAELEQRFHTAKTFTPSNADFAKIPGSPVAYWASQQFRNGFCECAPLSNYFQSRQGLSTGNNDTYVRRWHEVRYAEISFISYDRLEAQLSRRRWFPYAKGGLYRKWYGNGEFVVDWRDDGKQMQSRMHPTGRVWAHNFNLDVIFKEGITWSDIGSCHTGFRFLKSGGLFDTTGLCAFAKNTAVDVHSAIGYLNSAVASVHSQFVNPTMHFLPGDFARMPFVGHDVEMSRVASELISIANVDWDSHETSWDFTTLPILHLKTTTLQQSQEAADTECLSRFARMKELEEENNRLFIDAYGLQDELSPEVPDDQITLYRPNREEDIKRLLSYAIGCMMGRYRLDKPGLIYAHSGNVDFDSIYYTTDNTEGTDKNKNQTSILSSSVPSVLSVVTFPPDQDGIIPLLETDWGIRDDATNRIIEFLGVAWPSDPKAIKFVEESLGTTIRDYLAKGFYKHHLSMYKRRPIYWLFSSGKQRAFQCLVYLHRYHEGTLARMRTEYVIPLQGKFAARIETLEGDKLKATASSHRNKIQKEQDKLKKQQAELATFEEKLKHAADQKISIDLDDGVKVNYAKFGDLLAEVKAVTGAKEE